MAQIDELIAAMKARGADALILTSDRPAQLNFAGTLADGALVPAPLLRAMLHEIAPDTHINQLHTKGEWNLSYACDSGLMDVFVERRGPQLKMIVTPHNPGHNIFTPHPASIPAPAPTFPTYQTPVDSGFAPPLAPPQYQPTSLANYGATNQNVPAAYNPYAHLTPIKEKINLVELLVAVFLGCLASAIFLPFSFVPPLLTFLFAHQLFLLPVMAGVIAALGILADARVLGVRRGLVDGVGDLDPQGWFFTTLALGVLGVPLYLAARPSYKRALEKQRLKL